jgi:hypothetical protein
MLCSIVSSTSQWVLVSMLHFLLWPAALPAHPRHMCAYMTCMCLPTTTTKVPGGACKHAANAHVETQAHAKALDESCHDTWWLRSCTTAKKQTPCAENTLSGSHRGHTFHTGHTFARCVACRHMCKPQNMDTLLMYMLSLCAASKCMHGMCSSHSSSKHW